MSDYPTLAALGMVVGTGSFLAILVPPLVVQYWRYGRLSPTRLLATAAISVYLCSLIAFTLFPLPTVAEACGARTGPILQAVPFGFLGDIVEEAGKTSLPAALTLFVTMQVVLNVVLFVPFGVLVRGMTHRGIALTTVAGLATSLLIEATQYTGVWGLYPCGFRVADATMLTAPHQALATLGAALLVVALPALIGSGASWGQRMVGITPVWAGVRAPVGRRLLRAGAVGGVYAAGRVLPALLDGWLLLPSMIALGSALVVLVALVSALVGDHRGLSGWASGARMVDRRVLPAP